MLPFTFSANDSFSFLHPALLDLLPEILATLGYLRLCSHPLERLVMIVASLFRIFHPLGFLLLMSTICLFKYCPCRMLQFPILAGTFDHDSLLQYFIQTIQLLVMISSAWIESIKSFLKATVFPKTYPESCTSCFFENSFRTFGTRST